MYLDEKTSGESQVETIVVDKVGKLIADTADFFASSDKAWKQHSYGNKTSGYCLIGGLNHVRGRADRSDPFDDILVRRAVSRIYNRMRLCRSLVAWNDDKTRTKTEVIALLRSNIHD